MNPHSTPPSEILCTALEAATAAGEIAARIRNTGDLRVSHKGALDLLTRADLEAEQAIIAHIRERFPTHAFLSEETHAQAQGRALTGPLWVIDPIDGTTNYVHGHLHVGISIAFLNHGKLEAAVIHAPFLGETYTAERGKGAFCNNAPIRVSECTELSHALVATGFPYQRDHVNLLTSTLATVLMHCRDIRRNGAASLDLAWVASGRLDGYYEDIQPWDLAAGKLIALEAGAAILHRTPPPTNSPLPPELHSLGVIVAPPVLAEKFLKLLDPERVA